MSTLKVLAEGKGMAGDCRSEGSLSANLRANVQKQYQAEPQGESAQHDEAHLDLGGMVNTVVVQRKIVFLPVVRHPGVVRHSGICPTFASTWLEALRAVMHAVIGQKSADGVVGGIITDEAKA